MEQIISQELRRNRIAFPFFSNTRASVHASKRKHMKSGVLSGPRYEVTMYVWERGHVGEHQSSIQVDATLEENGC